ncbi:extracellular solute-binding protein, partial [Myxococcota bacterium]|nr:extracellular solute-binding protein [Myxococcota bacterium]
SFIPLPPRINLKSPAHKDFYRTVYAEVSGKKPGTTMKKYGAPMVYGVTIPKNAPNRPLAEKFLVFLLTREKGMKIMEEMGQTSLVPSPTKTFQNLPPALKPFASPKK